MCQTGRVADTVDVLGKTWRPVSATPLSQGVVAEFERLIMAGELAPGVWERGRPDAHSGPPAAFAFPLPGVGVMGFSTAAPLEPDATLLATMDSLGSQISQFVERCRAQADLRESDARKSAILNAALDCIITMDHHGNVVEVNRATDTLTVLVTHNAAIGSLADRVLRMRSGRIVAETRNETRASPADIEW